MSSNDELYKAIYEENESPRVVIVLTDDGESLSVAGFIHPKPDKQDVAMPTRPAVLVGAYLAHNMDEVVKAVLAWVKAASEERVGDDRTIALIDGEVE